MQQQIELRKVRDFNAKISETFDFTRRNFRPMAKNLVFISGPFVLLQGLFYGLYSKDTFARESATTVLWVGLLFFFYLVSVVVTLIVVYELVRLYELKKDLSSVEVADLWKIVVKKFFSVLGAVLIAGIMISLGTLLFIIPGIYVAVVLSLLIPIMLIEEKGFGEAFNRCFSLITDKWWSTFGLIFVTSIIVAVMAILYAVPLYTFVMIMALQKASSAGFEAPVWEQAGLVVGSMIYSLAANLFQSITLIAVAFQFFNLVERKEAQGLMERIESFGQAESESAHPDETY
jgi:hypothetical protein